MRVETRDERKLLKLEAERHHSIVVEGMDSRAWV